MRKRVVLAIFLLLLATLSAACSGTDPGRKSRVAAVTQRDEVYRRADALLPAPRPVNFPLRKALIKFTEREDLINHPWYVYILGMNGNVIGYYVAQTVPVNSCTFLSSTQRIEDDRIEGSVVLTAPSLDGIFYGGGGASAGCDEWFFFDTETDAMIKIRGVHFYVADQPLKLQAEPIQVQTVR